MFRTVGISFLLVSLVAPTIANAWTCELTDVTVTAPSNSLAANVCEAVEQARAVLDQCELPMIEGPLRIEIVESAAQADARNDEILARYGNDPIARAWVADCMTQAAAGREDREEFSASWAYACWRSWGDQRESPELDTGD